jgi:hypoxia up-regulated 1
VREEVLNSLEAFTYKARDYLEDESFIAASTSAIRSTLEEKLSAVSDWIYSEGHDAAEDVLKARLKELKDIVDPVLKRKDEAAQRPAAITELREAIDGLKSVIPMVKENIESAASASSKSAEEASKSSASPSPSPSADPLAELEDDATPSSESSEAAPPVPTEAPALYTEEDLKFLEVTVEKSTKWLEEKEAAQSKLKEHEDAAFSLQDLKDQTKKVNDAVMEMMTKKFRYLNQQQQQQGQQKKKTKSKAKAKKAAKKNGKKAAKDEESKKEEESKQNQNQNQQPTEEELREALEKAGIKGDGIKLENLGVKDELKDKDGKPLVKLDLGEGASEEDILAAIDRIVGEGKAKKAEEEKKEGHDEL